MARAVNVFAMSGRAAGGDVDTLLLDKTGLIAWQPARRNSPAPA
jgi:high-affinity K+ transport system ATPase subunit B